MLADLTIYSADAIVAAHLLFAEDRVSEFLAGSAPVALRGVRIVSLEDGRRVALDGLEVHRWEILMAVADNARGDPSRRVATAQRAAIAEVGPYRVAGRVHGPTSTDPIEIARRRPWIAITNAIVWYMAKGSQVTANHGAVLVNRNHLRSLVADEDSFLREAAGATAGAVAVLAAGAGDMVPEPARATAPRDAWPTELGTSSVWR